MADGDSRGEKSEVASRICPVHGAVKESLWDGHRCSLCVVYNETHGGRRKKQPLRERYEDEGVEKYTYTGRFDGKDFQAWLDRLAKDPARYAAALSDANRPRGVDRSRHGIAVRMKEPMLNATAQSIRNGLMTKDESNKGSIAKGEIYRYVTVKPLCLGAVRAYGGSWREQTWEVWTLQYGKGLVIRTEDGKESAIYSGWKSIVHAINAAGLGIIR